MLTGTAEHGRGRLQAAEQAFGRAIESAPGLADAHCARAAVRAALGDVAGAERDLARALEIEPAHVQSLCNLAILREREGDRAEARTLYNRALEHDDHCYPARLNRAAMRLGDGDAEAALADLDVLAAQPGARDDVHVSRARALFALFRDAEALDAAESALRIAPQNQRARLDRALALASLGRLDEAAQALASVPGAAEEPRLSPGAIRVSRLLLRQSICDWSTRDAAIAEVRRALDDPARRPALAEAGVVMTALGLPLSAQEQRRLGDAAFGPARLEGARLASSAPPLAAGSHGTKLRVGFFAASLRVHPESYLIRRLFADRDQAALEYVLYALNPDDGSALRAEIARHADRFVDASGWDSAAIVRAARGEQLDLAIDLSSGYVHGRPEIFAARVAPVQAAYLAAPSSLGPGLHDFRVTDAWATPPQAQADWDARLLAVAPSPFVHDDGVVPEHGGSRAEHGLGAGMVFTCMNQAFKIEPECFGAWMRLLGRIPGSLLWLLDPGALARSNLAREAEARGVSAHRLVFAPPLPLARHLGRLAHADLFLDTFHCNAHTTALDALRAGLPVLTRNGTTMASRLAGTFVRAAGLPELAVDTTADYEAMAARLATDRGALEQLKARLRDARATLPLFDTRARVRAVESAFREMAGR